MLYVPRYLILVPDNFGTGHSSVGSVLCVGKCLLSVSRRRMLVKINQTATVRDTHIARSDYLKVFNCSRNAQCILVMVCGLWGGALSIPRSRERSRINHWIFDY